MAVALATPNTKLFFRAVSSVLQGWQALRIAVDAGFGGSWGKEKASWLEEVTAQFLCENGERDVLLFELVATSERFTYSSTENVESWEVEERLALLMNQEFDTIIEDGSLTEVRTQLKLDTSRTAFI